MKYIFAILLFIINQYSMLSEMAKGYNARHLVGYILFSFFGFLIALTVGYWSGKEGEKKH